MSELAPKSNTAIVPTGGGATGAYEIGVMKALFHGLSPTTNGTVLEVDSFVGTSVGAFNASFMAAQHSAAGLAIDALEAIWRHQITALDDLIALAVGAERGNEHHHDLLDQKISV